MKNTKTANIIQFVMFIIGIVLIVVGTSLYFIYKKKANDLQNTRLPFKNLDDWLQRVAEVEKQQDDYNRISSYGIWLIVAGAGFILIPIIWIGINIVHNYLVM